MANRNLVIYADDLGLSKAFNAGILKTAQAGFLTSTSIRINGSALGEAISEVLPQCPHLGLGLHLNIVEGITTKSFISKSSELYDSDGTYRLNFASLFRGRKNKFLLQEIEDDYRDQIERCLKIATIDHFNSHQHSHAIPEIFEIVCRLAKEYGIPYVRLPVEKYSYATPFARHVSLEFAANLAKIGILNTFARKNKILAKQYGILTNDWFIGLLYTGLMDEKSLLSGLNAIPKGPILVETLFHPGQIVASKDETYLNASLRDYVIDAKRNKEFATLNNKNVLKEVHDLGFTLTNYSKIIAKDDLPIIPKMESLVVKDQKNKPLSTFVIIDETPFFHPEYLFRLISECEDLNIQGAALVKLPNGGVLKKYLLKHWYDLGLGQLFLLGIKQILIQLWGKFPRVIRGDFDSSVETVLKRFKIPFRIVNKVNTKDFLNYLENFSPDIILSSNSLIFGEKLIKIPKVACINRHSAILPACGGILPVFRSVQLGHQFTGATIHHVVKKIDKGPIISRKWLPIFPGDKLHHLYKLCFVLSFEATVEAAKLLRAGQSINLNDDPEIPESYYTYPTSEEWKQFHEKSGRFI